MFGWFKKKEKEPEEVPDTSEEIYLDASGSCFYPLTCDPFIYSQSLDSIRQLLLRWIKQDRSDVDGMSIKFEGTISYLLFNFDLKLLPYDVYLSQLLTIVHDTDLNKSGNRLMDTIALINTIIPQEALDCFKGKFLYSMLYGLPPALTDDNLRPTKAMWIRALDTVPWAPFILLIQELMMMEAVGEPYTPVTIGAPAVPVPPEVPATAS